MKKLIKLLPVVLAMLMLFSFGAFAEETGEIPGGEQNVTEVVLPATPTNVKYFSDESWKGIELSWAGDDIADGYEICVKENGNWVFLQNGGEYCMTDIYGLLRNSVYEIGVRAYVEVDGEKYYSEGYGTCTVYTDPDAPLTSFQSIKSERYGIRLKWAPETEISGYRLYVVKDGKWTKIKDIYGKDNTEYFYTDVKVGTKYRFGIKTFVKGTRGLKFSSLETEYFTHEDVMRVNVKAAKKTSSTVTLSWNKAEDACGYRVYVYQSGKWKALKTTTALSYQVTGLEASKRYIFRVKAYSRINGEVIWHAASANCSVITSSKTVDAYRIENLQKDFSDGDWYVQIKNQDDGYGNKVTMTFAGKGDNIFYRYQLGKQTIEYFYQASKNRLYMISDADKEYVIVPNDEAESFVESMFVMAEIVKVQNVGKVTAKTCVYNGYSAVQETYTDTVYGFNKTYYFVKDKVAGLTVELEGAKDEYKNFSVVDTPSSSLFKVPSGYKKVSWN